MKKGIIVVMGLTGTGKSSLAKVLAEKLKWPILSSDPIRKRLVGAPLYEKRRNQFGSGLYTKKMSMKVYNTMLGKAENLLETSQGVILDATFIKRDWREGVRSLAERLGMPLLFVMTTAPDEEVKNRLKKREREKTVSDGRWEIYVKQKETFELPHELDAQVLVVDTRSSSEELVNKIMEVWDAI